MLRYVRSHFGYLGLIAGVVAASAGLNLAVFTIVNALWLRPLPFPDHDRVVTLPRFAFVTLDQPEVQIFDGGVAGQVTSSSLSGEPAPLAVGIPGGPNAAEAVGVTANYFNVLGLNVRGRGFTRDDDQLGAEPVAVISDRLWASAFDRQIDVIGTVISSSPFPVRVVGIAPRGFEGIRRGERVDVWLPSSLAGRLAGSTRPSMLVLGRMGPEQTPELLNQQFESLAPGKLRLLQTGFVPLTETFGVSGGQSTVLREARGFAATSALASLLLIAGWATVAALVMLHYERRRGELALKESLGAGRLRIIRELYSELAAVAAVSITAALCVAKGILQLLPSLQLPGGIDMARLDLSLDWRVVTFGVLTTSTVLLAAAAVPIARAVRLNIAGQLITGLVAGTRESMRTRQSLLAVQIASTAVVLICAGLLTRAVMRGFGTEPGFTGDQVVFVSVNQGIPPSEGASQEAVAAERNTRLTLAFQQLNGVQEVARTTSPASPISPEAAQTLRSQTFLIAGEERPVIAGVMRGGDRLLPALGVPIIAGRSLVSSDEFPDPRPAVITRSLAEKLWPGDNALGQGLALMERGWQRYTVVGIAADIAFGSLANPTKNVLVSVAPSRGAWSRFVIRTDQPDRVARLLPDLVGGKGVVATTGRELIAKDIGRQRLGAWFFSLFGVTALILATGGTYGLVAYVAQSRRHEFGVRIALGADRMDVLSAGLSVGVVPLGVGLAGGLVAGALVARVFSHQLVGVSYLDPTTYGLVGAITVLSSFGAGTLAAWRLRAIEPAEALRVR
jgi:predicted permease